MFFSIHAAFLVVLFIFVRSPLLVYNSIISNPSFFESLLLLFFIRSAFVRSFAYLNFLCYYLYYLCYFVFLLFLFFIVLLFCLLLSLIFY